MKKQTFMRIVIGIFFGLLIIAMQTPLWKTKPDSNIVDKAGVVNVEGIRGSNTLGYLIKETKIPLEYFQSKFNLPADIDTTIKLKEIGLKYNLKN